jgi:hypothetical protein
MYPQVTSCIFKLCALIARQFCLLACSWWGWFTLPISQSASQVVLMTVYTMLFVNILVTEHHGQVVSTPALYLGGPGFKFWPGDWLS